VSFPRKQESPYPVFSHGIHHRRMLLKNFVTRSFALHTIVAMKNSEQ
jgi:hypothetical protein